MPKPQSHPAAAARFSTAGRRLFAFKTIATLAILAGFVAYFAIQWFHGRLGLDTGVAYSWTGAYRWIASFSQRLWLQLAAALLVFPILLGFWPRCLAPRGPVARWFAVGLALAWALALAVMQTLDFVSLYGVFVLLVVAAGFGLAYYLTLRPRNRPALAALGEALQRPLTWRFSLALVLVAFALYMIGWQEIFQRQPIMSDSQSQISQARLLLTGHVTLDVSKPLRDVIAFPYAVYSVPSYSQYPPGHILLLVPVLAAGLPPQALNLLAGILTLLLTVNLANRLEGPAVARAVGLLLLGSPLLLLVSVSAMNHATACLMLLLATWILIPDPRADPAPPLRRDLAFAALAGLALGWAVLTRPLTGLAQSLVWTGVWLALMIESLFFRSPRASTPRRLLARLAAVLAGLVPAAHIFMAYNNATTGDPFVMAYRESNPLLHRLGFHDAIAGGVSYTPSDAVDTLFSDILSLNHAMLGLAIGSWTLLLVWWLRTRMPRHQLVLAALVAMQSLLYKLYQFHDLFFGPRFLYEALPPMVILAGIALAPALRLDPPSEVAHTKSKTAGLDHSDFGFASDFGFRISSFLPGATFLILAILAVGAATGAIAAWGQKFSGVARYHIQLEEFVTRTLPAARPTAIVVPHAYEERIGRWFPQPASSPPVWFIVEEHLPAARQLPELNGFDWKTFSMTAQRPEPRSGEGL
jgi:hypothetical protein